MVGKKIVPVVALARGAPVRFCLFVVCPLVLATVQLSNSYVNGLTPLVSVPFALVMSSFAALTGRHTLSAIRLRRLEPDTSEFARSRHGRRY